MTSLEWKGPERRRNRQQAIVQSLEGRRLLNGQTDPSAYLDFNDNVVHDADSASLTMLANVEAASTKLPLTSVPVLNSDPGATDSIYLDFVGAPAMTWLGYSVPATPAYDQDGDPTTFTSAELTSIQEIWQGVAEMYSPFNINVTTVAPTSLVHGQNMEAIIGGSSTWVGATVGGVSYIGAFTASYLPNISFVFPGDLSNGTVKYTADATAHEIGHQLGLYHQATWSGTTLVSDYSYGTSADGPIMGDPYGDTRATWYDGTNDISSTTIQDDMSVISSATNGFGYRSDGISHVIASPNALTGSSLSASGILSTTSQVDYYSFTTGAGNISLSASQFSISGVFNGMLSLKFSLYNSADQLITSSGSGLSESLNTTVSSGTYIVAISSDGAYGDVGQYTFSGTTVATAPTVPTGLSASASGTSTVNLSWSDAAGDETGFYVERSTDDVNFTQIGSTASTTYQDTGLNSATTYYYRIRAYNAGGNSAYTSVASAITQTAIPTAPTSLLATATSTSAISLSWTDNSNNESGFYVERSPDNVNWTQIASVNANVTTYSDSNLSAATTYYYRVRAYNAGGNSAYTNVSNATTQTATPGTPSSLTATAISTTQINLSWTDNSNQTGFYVERSTDDVNFTQIGSTTSTTYQDTGLTSATKYYYRVRAYNAGGNSGYATPATATTQTAPPAAPTTPTPTVVSTSEIDLSWSDNSNQTGYYIERSPDNTNWSQIASTASTTYQDTGLNPSTLYYYRIRAYNTGGTSAYTTVISATTQMLAPTAPTTLTATANNTAEIDLTWTNTAANAAGVYIERSTDNANWSQITSVSSTTTTYQDTGLVAGSTYFYRLRSYNAGGDSAYCTTASAVAFPLVAPAMPAQDVAAAPNSFSQVSLSWTPGPGDAGFYVERSTDRINWSNIAQLPASDDTYTDTSADSGTHYFYRVIAYNSAGSAPASNLATATTPNFSSILDDSSSTGVTINGPWSHSTAVTGYYGTDFLTDNNVNKGQDSVVFTPTLPEDGTYQVSIRWTAAPNRATNVPVTVNYDGGSVLITLNQRQNGSRWILLGTFNFQAGTSASVTVSNANTNGVVVADAVQFTKVSTTQVAGYRLNTAVVIPTINNANDLPFNPNNTLSLLDQLN